MPDHTRNHKQVTITIPPEDHEKALEFLPHGEIRTFSALVREALSYFYSRKKK